MPNDNKHYHKFGVEQVARGWCDGTTYHKAGNDVLRIKGAIGLDMDLYQQLMKEGVKFVENDTMQTELANFVTYGIPDKFKGQSLQIFLKLEHWRKK